MQVIGTQEKNVKQVVFRSKKVRSIKTPPRIHFIR